MLGIIAISYALSIRSISAIVLYNRSMCGRYTLSSGESLYKRFKIDQISGRIKPNYNIAPGMMMPVVIRQSPNQIMMMKWGLIPSWAKDIRIGYKLINARVETLRQKPAFRSSLYTKRCFVPASGFYEWEHKERSKIPYYIKLKSEELFAFAGLYDVWKDAEGKEIRSYTIITCDSNKLVAKIHDRMPVILRKDHEAMWLKEGETDIDRLLSLLNPYPEKEMEAYVVSSLVNSPKNNNKSLIEAVKTGK